MVLYALGAAGAAAQASLSPREALGALKAGNDRFARNASSPVSLSVNRRQELAIAQHPIAMVLSCADSRVPPEFVFNAAAATPPVKQTPKQTLGVAPSASPKQVAAAIAEAIRSAEAAQVSRQAARTPASRRRTETVRQAPPPARRYEVHWPEQRMVVQWPMPTSDGVTLVWPVQ